MTVEDGSDTSWSLRPWVLAALLGTAGLAVFLVAGEQGPAAREAWRAALTALVFFGSLVLAFTLDPGRWRAPLAFAALVGTVMAGLAWRAVAGGDSYAGPEYGFMAGVIATALALPLFQAGFHRTRWGTDYRAIHGAVWSDAISAAGSLAFVGASWLMLLLLSELFHLLKLNFLRDLMREGAFGWAWSGAAFGAALGVFRNEATIIGTLRRVVMTVLSLLAVPLAAGLTIFLGAMILSGPDVLWEATRSATPVLLSCAAGAWVLANAILRDEDAGMSGNRVLRAAGLVLVLVILPLTVFAAVSMGTRIAQHGLSPERLWGLTAIAVAVAYGFAWLVAVLRGWRNGAWRERVRSANLHLAVLMCGLALFLALPILDFGAISAQQQVARLENGKVSAEDFDYSALRWDFGRAGRRALAQLAASGDRTIAKPASEAQAEKMRVYRPRDGFAPAHFDLRMQSPDPGLERMVREYIRYNEWVCLEYCAAIDIGGGTQGRRRVAIVGRNGYTVVLLPFDPEQAQVEAPTPTAPPLLPNSTVGIGTFTRRYVTVDGKPFGRPLDETAAPLEGPPPPR